MTRHSKQTRVGALESDIATSRPDGPLHVYRLEPSTRPDDPRWDNAPNHGVVRVRALSPADARVVAAESEIDFLDIDAKPGDGTTTDFASAFRDDKLYHVLLEKDAEVAGQRGLIRDD